jgi:esterase/lipase
MAGVMVLHDCRADREKYKVLTQALADEGLHVLAIDFRGYGESIAKGYSHQEIKKQATDIVSYQSDLALLTSYWPDDLLASYNFLRNKLDKSKGIAVIASGCANAYAINVAEKYQLKALVMINPDMSYNDKERYKNLIDVPSYFIGAGQHLASTKTALELFNWNGAKQSKIQMLKAEKGDSQLINSNKYLVADIANWLKFNLR